MPSPFSHRFPNRTFSSDGTVSEWRRWSEEFCGTLPLKNIQREQTLILREWASSQQWDWIRSAHYDWWLFPLSGSSSGCGSTYACPRQAVEELKQDPSFVQSLDEAAEILLASWGWDLWKEKPHVNGRSYNGPDVRLGKLAESLTLFGRIDCFAKVQTFAKQAASQIVSSETRRHLGIF